MDKLSSNQRAALLAMLAHGTVTAAAESCGLSTRTLERYLANEDFVRELQKRQDAITANAVARLTSLAGESVDAAGEALQFLRDVTRDEEADSLDAARLGRLALAILDERRRQAELAELVERIEALEARIEGN